MAIAMTGTGTFARGVHPPEGKHFAEEQAIEVMPTPSMVRIPVLQHIGAPCELVVKPRKEIALGDVVGKARGFISSPVHASVSGKTLKEAATTLPNGRHISVLPIEAAAEQPLSGQALFDDVFGGSWPLDALEQYTPEQISQATLEAGIVGMGGAAFPSHVKLVRNDKKPIDSLLINGCECEPYLTSDYRMMVEAAPAVVCGVLLAQRATGAKDAFIGVEDNKPKAIDALRKAAEGTGVEVVSLPTKYPQGGEKQLVMAILGREVPTGGLPLDVGVVVMNVGTAASVARAVVRGKPLTHRVVTVTGGGIVQPKNLLVPIGASYGDLIAACGGLKPEAACVVAGGPMMGFTLGQLDVPVTKGTSGITVLTKDDVRKASETGCVRCGRCVDVCPLNLVPSKLALAARFNNIEVAEKYFVSACMECGCCAYACPAQIPLVQLIRYGKIQVNAAKAKEKAKAEAKAKKLEAEASGTKEAKPEVAKPKDEKPKTEKPKDEAKTEKPKDEAKAEKPKDEAKAEKPKDEAKAEKPKDEAKAEKPKDEAKTEEPKDEAKTEEPKDEAKDEKPKDEAKAEKPKDEAKTEKPKDEAKTEKPKDEAKTEKPKDEAKTEKPKDEAKDEKPKDEAKTEEPKDEAKAEKPKDESKAEKPKDEDNPEKSSN
ncbi:MAG: electron transport complex subunit RsxC, partial [Myxococcota bacterium]|nr:electron transport complex subunit RsxC [Myxococcota bacterium]